MQRGSRINYSYYINFDPKTDVEKLGNRIDPRLEKEDLNMQTVASQKEQTSRSFEDLTRFLALIGFIALLLGCIGVASSINIYVREKLKAIAIMRCLGVKSSEAFLIFFNPDCGDRLYRLGSWRHIRYSCAAAFTHSF